MENSTDHLITIPRVTDPRGNLSFIQHPGACPFKIERVYWIYDVPGDFRRYGRALRSTAEMIVALSGSFDVELEYKDGTQKTVRLNRAYRGVVVPPMTWRVLDNFSTNAVVLVLASSLFDEDKDYIRDYEHFKQQI